MPFPQQQDTPAGEGRFTRLDPSQRFTPIEGPSVPMGQQPSPEPLQGAGQRFMRSFTTGSGFEPTAEGTMKNFGEGASYMAQHPLDAAGLTLHGLADSQQQLIDRAYQEQHSPDWGTKIHGLISGAYSAIPMFGPMMAQAGDQYQSGDIAGGTGTMAAMAAPLIAEHAAGSAMRPRGIGEERLPVGKVDPKWKGQQSGERFTPLGKDPVSPTPAAPKPEDPALQAINAMRERKNVAPKPPTGQQTQGSIGDSKGSMAPSATAGESEMEQTRRAGKGDIKPPQTEDFQVERRQSGEAARQKWEQEQEALRAQGKLGEPGGHAPLTKQPPIDPKALAAEKERGLAAYRAAPWDPNERRGEAPKKAEAPAQPFELPKRKPDTTKAFPDRKIGEQTKGDVVELLKSQLKRGDIDKAEFDRKLKAHLGVPSPEPGKGFRLSSMEPDAQKRLLESTGANKAAQTPITPEGATAPKEPAIAAGPKSAEPAAKPVPVAETPSKDAIAGNGKPVAPTSGEESLFDRAKSDDRILKALKTISAKLQELPKQLQKTARKTALAEMEKHIAAGKNPLAAGEEALKVVKQYKDQAGFIGGGKVRKAGDIELEAKERDESIADRLKGEHKALAASRKLDQTLFDLQGRRQGDLLEAKQKVEKMADSADHKAIYHSIESGGKEPLTDAQKKIAREEVQPVLAESKKEIQKLKDLGMPTKEYENYLHRIAAKKGSKLEMALLGRKKFSAGGVLTKTASSMKKASYGVAESPAGRVVVSTKGDKVYAWHKGKAELMPTGKEDLEAAGWVFGRGTTKEITPATGQKYFEHAGINSTLNLLELKRLRQGAEAIEAYKASPEFKEFAHKEGEGNPPKGWKSTGVPQFKGYSFEPHTAEVLDRYWKRVQGGDSNALEHLNHFLVTSIFFNPMIHVPNIASHWFVEKGVAGFGPQAWPRVAKTSWMAVHDVLTQSDRFRIAHEFGTPFQSSRMEAKKFDAVLQTKMIKELSENQGMASKIASQLGYAHPANLVKALYNFSSKVTWVSQDIAFLQATYDRMYRGNDTFSANSTKVKVEFDHAMREVGKHIPNYQVPTRIMNSRAIAEVMTNPAISMFGAYHYGAMKSYFEIAKELVHPDLPIAERAKALDRVAALALTTYAMYWAQDKLRDHFKDPNLKMRFPGASTIPHNVIEYSKGRKGLTAGIESSITPAPLAKIAADTIGNAPREAKLPPGEQAKKIGQRALDAVGPYSAYKRAQTGPDKDNKSFDWKSFLLNMAGVYQSQPKGQKSGLPGVGKLGKLQKLK